MRSVKEIEADIEVVKNDIKELRKIGATTIVAMCDLIDLRQELAEAKRSEQSKVCEMKIKLIECPSEKDWMEAKRRALVTVGLKPVNPPDKKWKHEILLARHSPIRRLCYSFYMEIPYWVSVHLCRHVHAQPYVKSQRNDRQSDYDRNSARQDATVCMIWDVNAEELQEIANKRLCKMASKETREVVAEMCRLAEGATPELKGCLVPMCERCGGVCHEMHGGCKREVNE